MGRPKKAVSEENIERFQRELELAGDKLDVLLKDKKGRSRSCLLCRRRKQRCDHKLPSCTACLKAAVKCVQPARYFTSSNNSSASSPNTPQSKPDKIAKPKAKSTKKAKNSTVKGSEQSQHPHEYASKLQNVIDSQNFPVPNSHVANSMYRRNMPMQNNSHMMNMPYNGANDSIHMHLQQSPIVHQIHSPYINKEHHTDSNNSMTYASNPNSPLPNTSTTLQHFQHVYSNSNGSMNNIHTSNNMLPKQTSLPPLSTPLMKQEYNNFSMQRSPSNEQYVASCPESESSRINLPVSLTKVAKKNESKKKKNKNETNQDKDEYTLFLEKKLKYLEKIIDTQPNSPAYLKKIKQYKKISHLLGDIGNLEDIEKKLKKENNAAGSPQAGNNSLGQPSSAISTPTASIATPNSGILPLPPVQGNHSNVYPIRSPYTSNGTPVDSTNKDTIPALSSDSLDSVDFSKCIFGKYNLKEFLSYDPAFEFDEQLSRSFLDTFFTRLQFKYPLLDEDEIYTFHENYLKNQIYSYSETNFHFACGRMWMVFTISACLHMTTGKYKGQPPVRYFSTAIRHITRCGNKLTPVQELELSTLLVLYIVRTDSDSMLLYEIIKDVMNICKNKLQLHKWHANDQFASKKLRLFWCVYLLERMICVAVGKPYTIHENEIEVPFFDENSFFTHSTFNTSSPRRSGVHFINQSLKLRRIESHFVEVLKILPATERRTNNKSEIEKQLPVVKRAFHELELWRAGCLSNELRNFENETLKLYYYRSVRLLIQPFLEVLRPEDRLFRECQASAGQICQLYKIFHQKTVTGHSTPAVHTVFVAGVTLIYCMWLARNYDDEKRRKLGDISKHTRPLVSASLFSTMDDLRACSVCLYVMTERSHFAKIFRDTFDQLMNATVGNLIERCGPDSAELIYMKQNKKKGNTGKGNQITDVCGNSDEPRNKSNMSKEDSKNQPKSKADLDDEISSTSSDMMISKNGMPPAVDRTFGKRQASEHVGFVENSQVDLDNAEKEKLKMQKGVLEKTTVPKGLSHLLIEENEMLMEENNKCNEEKSQSLLSKNSPEPTHLIRNTESVKSMDSSGTSSPVINEYIVQKPINATSFDWNLFKQQAFLQQHLAQQNLQAYLSSLKYENDGLESNSASEQAGHSTSFTGQLGFNPSTDNRFNMNNGARNQNGFPTLINSPSASLGANSPPLTTETYPPHANVSSSKKEERDPNLHYSSSVNNQSPLHSVTSAHTPNNQTSQPGNPTSYSSANPNNNILNVSSNTANNKTNGMILFSNGTHDMINNISTWTNDSVVEFMNTEDDGLNSKSTGEISQTKTTSVQKPNEFTSGNANTGGQNTISRSGTPAWSMANGYMSGITFSSGTDARNDTSNGSNPTSNNNGNNSNIDGYNMNIFSSMGSLLHNGAPSVDADGNNDGTEIYSEMLF